MSLAAIGLKVDQIDSAPLFTVGARAAVDSTAGSGVGVKEYMYVQLTASTAYTVGQAVLISAAGVALPALAAGGAAGQDNGSRVGVMLAASESTTAARYTWVQIYGAGAVAVAASCARRTQLVLTSTAGVLDDAATGVLVHGIMTTTTATDAAVVAAQLNYPMLGATAA